MVFYKLRARYRMKSIADIKAEEKIDDEDNISFISTRIDRKWKEDIAGLNDQLGMECALDGGLSMIITDGKPEKNSKGVFNMIAGLKLEEKTLSEGKKAIVEKMWEVMPYLVDFEIVSMKESCVQEITKIADKANDLDFCNWKCWSKNDMKADYFDNRQFKVKEKCYLKEQSLEELKSQAELIMADESLLQELERIYSPDNVKKYYGQPVHYKLTVGSMEAAMDIVDIMVPALRANNRLVGSRVTQIYDVDERCYDEDDLKDLFYTAQGNSVVIDLKGSDGMHGNYASSYEQVVDFFNTLAKDYGINTLCFYVDNTEHPGFSNSMISKVSESMDIVEIKEGCGDYGRAVKLFQLLSDKTDFPATEVEIRRLLPKKKVYTATEVYQAYKKWYGNGLKEKVYKTYQTCQLVQIDKKEKPKSEPYKELQDMVGLEEIKKVVDQIIATGKMREMKSKMGLDTDKQSMHMIFTGNPGSAKTSVARLIAQILKKEGILDSGNFVEVGRSDLIARWVGWTAKTVVEKFHEARGGILFIDEAYSLVDDSNTFGDEAINTIVQEMENHREDVIVIFAGYPEKMKSFLDKNEGLRSRIAFHLNFPDYNPEEMWHIIQLMARNKKLNLADGVEERCMKLFENACAHEEFGNGRYARNLLEQAVMHQSQRLFDEYKGKRISKSVISELKPEDFETNASQQFKESKSIGFCS